MGRYVLPIESFDFDLELQEKLFRLNKIKKSLLIGDLNEVNRQKQLLENKNKSYNYEFTPQEFHVNTDDLKSLYGFEIKKLGILFDKFISNRIIESRTYLSEIKYFLKYHPKLYLELIDMGLEVDVTNFNQDFYFRLLPSIITKLNKHGE